MINKILLRPLHLAKFIYLNLVFRNRRYKTNDYHGKIQIKLEELTPLEELPLMKKFVRATKLSN